MKSGLFGYYAWPIKLLYGVTVFLFVALFFYALQTGGGWAWMGYAVGMVLVFAGLLFLYSQRIFVDINGHGVFIRQRLIDVSTRIKYIVPLGPGKFMIYFNPLYQLYVVGDLHEVQQAWSVLASRFPVEKPPRNEKAKQM
ncbi:hypothetical protein [Sulfobacillus thermosulfidooxidans]|uniref:hypothetical protein n=1 Tax=Sulfobacillus thermosulfidooxidans TaxID=28034 RepID=UPI0006B458E6|nr:hypothetical protein [Sulfobacillus thermosulfidooxidans]